jgi:hypothetical protein
MATTATRQIQIVFSGDVVGTQTHAAADNTVSPGTIFLINLDAGPNEVPVQQAGGAVSKAVTIVPPVGNTLGITLKGVAGDTGVALHLTDPSSIALDPSVDSIVLDAEDAISGVQITWN